MSTSAFQSISVENVDLERDQLQNIATLTKRLWQNEISLYEEDETEEIGSVNYNEEELVWDSKRYPYHESLLPLLDIYNFVSQQQTTDDHEHFPTNVFDPKRRIPNAFEARLPGYLPCSALAAVLSLLPPYRAKDTWSGLKEALGDVPINAMHLIPVDSFLHPASSDFSFLETWHVDIAKDKSRWAREGSAYHSLDDQMASENYQNNETKFGPCHFPLEKGERTKILLKLLKHSMSDLQRDHRLASSVVFAMIECRCFDGGTQGLDALRYFLTIIDSECIRFCDGECHENFLQRGEEEDSSDEESIGLDQNENGVARPDHFCEDWHTFMVSLRSLITFGIDDFSEKHAEVISAFVIQQFEKGGYAEIEDKHEDLGCWHEDVDINTPLDVIINVIFGLRGLITLLRSRMKMLLRNLCSYSDNDEKTIVTEKELEKTSKSYFNCLSTIVYVGENAILRLPAFYQSAVLGSHIVQALLFATTDVVQVTRHNYLGESANDDIRMDSFERYSSSITFAYNQADQRLQDTKNAFLSDCDITKIQNNEIMRQIFLAAPPNDVQDVVRGLFLRQLVQTEIARFGYGDFLVWNRLPVTPLESLIFEHEVNFPEDEESQEGLTWCFDKDLDDVITGGRLAAQYDFTVLMLNRAWNQPWSPKSNSSFQRPYRQAITTLALCTQRYGIPSDILIGLNEFIPRSWWPDERAECWRFECQVKKFKKLLKEKDFMRRCSAKQVVRGDQCKKQKKLVVCPGCSIAHGCSMKHIKCIEGHGKVCKTPPCKILSIEDLGFCKQIVGETETNKTANHDESDSDNEEESDDGSCWESIASGSGSTDGKKELIYRYFNTNAYKLQKFEEPAFANFYNETE